MKAFIMTGTLLAMAISGQAYSANTNLLCISQKGHIGFIVSFDEGQAEGTTIVYLGGVTNTTPRRFETVRTFSANYEVLNLEGFEYKNQLTLVSTDKSSDADNIVIEYSPNNKEKKGRVTNWNDIPEDQLPSCKAVNLQAEG